MSLLSSSAVSRRGFAGSVMAGVAASLAGPGFAQQTPAAALPPRAGRNSFVYRFHIGDIEAFSINDVNLGFREGVGLMWPQEARPAMTEELERHRERLDVIPFYANVLVIRSGREVAVFDAGFGAVSNPEMGWFFDGLAVAGIKPEEVTMGFLSHAHVDHLNGFVRNGKPAFPNAVIHLLPEELSFWREKSPDFSKSKRDQNAVPGMIREVRAHYDMLGDRLQTVKDGTELLGGKVRVEAAPGHTLGHACFRIRSGQEELLHLSDLAHHHLLMFADPGWTIAFDHLPELSVTTRKRYWAEAAAKRTRCFGFHLPFPGLGTIMTEPGKSGGYRWWPERWSWGDGRVS